MIDPTKHIASGNESADPQERSMVESVAPAAVPARVRNLGDAWVIVELAPVAVLVIDERGHIELANRAAEVMFGYDRQSLATLGVDALVPDGRREAHRGHRAAFDASPRTRHMGLGLDLWARRADGSEFAVEVSLSPITFGHGPRMVAIVRDVTDQRAREQVARDQLVLADEERIGAELCHGVINRLFASGLSIQAVANRVAPEAAQQLFEIADELDIVIAQIRDIVLVPPRLDHPAA